MLSTSLTNLRELFLFLFYIEHWYLEIGNFNGSLYHAFAELGLNFLNNMLSVSQVLTFIPAIVLQYILKIAF